MCGYIHIYIYIYISLGVAAGEPALDSVPQVVPQARVLHITHTATHICRYANILIYVVWISRWGKDQYHTKMIYVAQKNFNTKIVVGKGSGVELG